MQQLIDLTCTCIQVKHCTANKIPFVAQSGAHAWATTFRIDESGIVVNMRTAFAKVEVDSDALVATVGGGATVQEFMRAGKEKKCHASEDSQEDYISAEGEEQSANGWSPCDMQ